MSELLERLEVETEMHEGVECFSPDATEEATQLAVKHIIEIHNACDSCSAPFEEKEARVLYDGDIVCVECYQEICE